MESLFESCSENLFLHPSVLCILSFHIVGFSSSCRFENCKLIRRSQLNDAHVTFDLQVLYDREFYENKSFIYRLWYMYPTFFIFRTRMYIAFKLSEAVCVMAGIGMYPTLTKPKLGSGPSGNFDELEKL